MTPEIKTRLAQIQRGEVPEGYKEIGTSIIPNNWTKAPFSKIGTISSGLVDPQKPPYSTMQHIGPENIEKDTGRILETKTACELGLISGKFYFDADSIVYSKIRPNLNKACAPDFEGICSADCYSIKPKDNIDKRFLLGLMLSNSFYRRAVACSMRTGMPKINQDDLNLIPLCFPQSIGEQKKVAEILGVLDRVVTLKEQLIAEKRRQKQYLMQQFLTGRQQPPGFNGEWKRIKLGSVLKERKEKNNRQDLRICSVSVHRGVVDQIEYLGRSYAASDTSKYNVVCYGDIIYTKSPTGDFPLGIIKQSHMNEAVAVSPLYGVFIPHSFELGYILHSYFQYSNNVSNYLKPITQKGAKNTINVSNSDFLSNYLFLPSDDREIRYLSNILSTADQEIALLEKDLEQEKQKKKALMQLLLTGIVRV